MSKHFHADGPEHCLTRLNLFSQGANQHLIKLTGSRQMVPLQDLWKVLVLMVDMRLEGGEKQHSHMNSGSVTFSVIHSFHTLREYRRLMVNSEAIQATQASRLFWSGSVTGYLGMHLKNNISVWVCTSNKPYAIFINLLSSCL